MKIVLLLMLGTGLLLAFWHILWLHSRNEIQIDGTHNMYVIN